MVVLFDFEEAFRRVKSRRFTIPISKPRMDFSYAFSGSVIFDFDKQFAPNPFAFYFRFDKQPF